MRRGAGLPVQPAATGRRGAAPAARLVTGSAARCGEFAQFRTGSGRLGVSADTEGSKISTTGGSPRRLAFLSAIGRADSPEGDSLCLNSWCTSWGSVARFRCQSWRSHRPAIGLQLLRKGMVGRRPARDRRLGGSCETSWIGRSAKPQIRTQSARHGDPPAYPKF